MTQDDNAPVTDETAAATGPGTDEAGQHGEQAGAAEGGKAGKAAPDADADADVDADGKDAGGKDGKAIWMGSAAVGIGSAALVAALMYARRRK